MRRRFSKKTSFALRQGVFARAKEEWSEWITQHPTHRFRYFAQQPLNNAVIIH